MNSSFLSQGELHMQIGDERLDASLNAIPNPAVRTFLYNNFVQTGYPPLSPTAPAIVPGFNRFSGLRYYKDKNYLEHLQYNYRNKWNDYAVWLDPSLTRYNDYGPYRNYHATPTIALTDPCMNAGSAVMYVTGQLSVIGEYPNNFGYPLITCVDVPGTTVGNSFKHPVGRSANFNEIGQIALSQGSIVITGVYNPPENLMYPATYQVYHTKSGGTGVIVGGVKTTGETFPGGTNNYTFKDTTFAGFSAGDADGNHYIAIRSGNNIGTFKITAYIDVNTVETDAATINQPFANATGLTWTMRTGPIGEYFFRRRCYVGGTTWVGYPIYSMNYGAFSLGQSWARAYDVLSTLTERENVVSIHDRGACRWMLADHGQAGASYAGYGLMRWTEFANHGIDFPYLDGDIDNMPTGIRYWRDMDIDGTSSNKLWIGIDDSSTAVGYSLFKVDPYPSGDAERPDCVAKYSKQANAADATGLPSKNVRGVCCDTFNNRIWVICGNDGAGGDGGLAYTEDGGTTWSRMHKLSTLTGTLAAKATGSTTAIAGNLYYDGQKIVIGDGHPSTPHTVTFSFTGGQGAVSLVSVADNGSGKARITLNQWTAYPIGSAVIISGSTYYNGTWDVLTKIADNIWDIDVAYTATDTGSVAWQPAGGWDASDVEIALLNSDTASQVGNKIRPIINAATLFVTAGGTNDSLPLTNDDYGTGGNVTVTTTTSMSVSGMSGGSGWTVAGDGVTVNNPLANSAFLTELAAGDWITMTGVTTGQKKRKIASITDNNTLVLAASTTFSGPYTGAEGLPGTSGSSVKGCLTDTQCRLLFISAVTVDAGTDGYIHPPCDYDTDGRLYWVPDSAGTGGSTPAVCRVSPTDTTMPSTLTNSQLSGTQTFEKARSVTVTKFANVAGSGTTTFQNNVWVGSYATAMTRVYDWATPSITRYHWSVSNSWPTSIDLSNAQAHYNMRAVEDLKTGMLILTVQSLGGSPNAYVVQTQSKNTHTTFGQVGTELGSAYYYLTYSSAWAQAPAYTSWNFDDLGLGGLFVHHFPASHLKGSPWYTGGTLARGYWTCFRWNGSTWGMGIVNGYWADLDFGAVDTPAGPHTECTTTCGSGTKRAMEIETPLDNGLYVKFVQAGGGTLQQNEFIVDENTTFTCSVGRVKDNTMTASFNIDVHALPTIVRLDEPTVNMGSLWTAEDGVDGGYTTDALDTAHPAYMRGVAEYTAYNASGTANYPNMAHVWSNPTDPHFMVARRIHETFYDAGDLDIWNDAGVGKAQCPTGTYTFTVLADVNKTLRVHGAATGGNNTSKLITAVDEGTNTVTLSSAWAADENDRKWTLRLIPAVGYVALVYAYVENAFEQFLYMSYKLHSSKDAGANWDAVKSTKYFAGVAANDPITKVGATGYIDAGVFCDAYGLAAAYVRGAINDPNQMNRAIVFDVRELSQEARRRTHWKIHRENSSGQPAYNARPASMVLLDENYVPMGPASLFVSDRSDPLFMSMQHSTPVKAVMYESTNAATGVDMGYGYSFTDVIQVGGGESFWEQNNTDLIAFANTTKVKSTAATFTISDVGKKLRVPLLSVTGGTYDGFVTIDTLVDADTVLVNRTVASQATGSITGVTNNAGQAVFASAGHTLVNGDAVTITGTTDYDGQWIVANVVAGVSFEAGVAYTMTKTGTWNKGQTGLTWALTIFGPTDKVRFDDTTTFFRHIGKPLTTMTYTVADVPASNQIKVTTKDIPLSVSSTFNVERDFATFTSAHQQATAWDTTFSGTIDYRMGIFQASDAAQFNLIQEDSATETATSSADDDGDGWTNEITLTGITLSAQAAANDWILLYKTTGSLYRRWYKIKSITSYGPGAVIKTYEDEIAVSSTFKWKVCRKRGLKMRLPAVNVVGSTQMT